MKWTEGNLFSLLSHWVHCYRIARADAARLPRIIWVSYDGFVRNPEAELDRMLNFLGLTPHGTEPLSLKNENEKYFAAWRERYYGDGGRAIEQKAPGHPRSLVTRARERFERESRERALPGFRRRANLRHFHDALDAAALLEEAIAEFGYSFRDLEKAPGL